jgi:hypothetical protein
MCYLNQIVCRSTTLLGVRLLTYCVRTPSQLWFYGNSDVKLNVWLLILVASKQSCNRSVVYMIPGALQVVESIPKCNESVLVTYLVIVSDYYNCIFPNCLSLPYLGNSTSDST